MEQTLFDIFKPEIDEKINQAVSDALNMSERNHLYCYVQDGDMTLDKAAKRLGMSPADFTRHMTEAGYSAPKMA